MAELRIGLLLDIEKARDQALQRCDVTVSVALGVGAPAVVRPAVDERAGQTRLRLRRRGRRTRRTPGARRPRLRSGRGRWPHVRQSPDARTAISAVPGLTRSLSVVQARLTEARARRRRCGFAGFEELKRLLEADQHEQPDHLGRAPTSARRPPYAKPCLPVGEDADRPRVEEVRSERSTITSAFGCGAVALARAALRLSDAAESISPPSFDHETAGSRVARIEWDTRPPCRRKPVCKPLSDSSNPSADEKPTMRLRAHLVALGIGSVPGFPVSAASADPLTDVG